jgi:hypothetical protein
MDRAFKKRFPKLSTRTVHHRKFMTVMHTMTTSLEKGARWSNWKVRWYLRSSSITLMESADDTAAASISGLSHVYILCIHVSTACSTRGCIYAKLNGEVPWCNGLDPLPDPKRPRVHTECNSVLHSARPQPGVRILHSWHNKWTRILLVHFVFGPETEWSQNLLKVPSEWGHILD